MKIRIQVIKVYDVETDGGDTTDPKSVEDHLRQVYAMSCSEIEKAGNLVDVTTDYAGVVDS